MGTDSPGPAYYEPPDEPEPPSLADWLKRNNAPRCKDCGKAMNATREQAGDDALFLCRCGGWSWVSIRPLSQAEREED